jgi:hypothetical protein
MQLTRDMRVPPIAAIRAFTPRRNRKPILLNHTRPIAHPEPQCRSNNIQTGLALEPQKPSVFISSYKGPRWLSALERSNRVLCRRGRLLSCWLRIPVEPVTIQPRVAAPPYPSFRHHVPDFFYGEGVLVYLHLPFLTGITGTPVAPSPSVR